MFRFVEMDSYVANILNEIKIISILIDIVKRFVPMIILVLIFIINFIWRIQYIHFANHVHLHHTIVLCMSIMFKRVVEKHLLPTRKSLSSIFSCCLYGRQCKTLDEHHLLTSIILADNFVPMVRVVRK